MDKIFVFDAVHYLFRSYYAIGPMLGDQGQSTHALFGFIRTVQKLIRDVAPTHFICVFDGPDNKKSRQTVYADYKIHRKSAPEDLFPQIDLAYQYCALAGIPILCVEGVEADDTMASVALLAKQQNAIVYLCSSDKDLMQLIDNQVFMLQPHKENLVVDAAKVHELFGVRPNQMLDLLAIMGDASDNIPGLEGFGPKTAASLLTEFGTLDHLLANPHVVKGDKKQEILRTQKETALLSRQLATLNMEVEIPKETAFYQLQPPNKEALADFYQKMKFHSLLKELASPQPAPTQPTFQCKAALHLEEKPALTKEYKLVDAPEELEKLLRLLSTEKEICIDTETTDVRPFIANLVGIGFSFEEGKGYYVPLNGKLGKKQVLDALKHFFSHTEAGFYGHNLKYDYHILAGCGIHVRKIAFDTLLASYVIDPQNRKHNLDELSLDKFQHAKIPFESLVGKGKSEISMRDVPIAQVAEYCCEDVDYTLRLKKLFAPKLREMRLEKIFYDIELPLLPILANMEKTGISLDVAKLRSIGETLVKDLQHIKAKIFEAAKEDFNLNSPKQLSHLLYTKMGIPSNTTSTSADVLEELAPAYPFVQLILDYRSLEKLRSTYIEALPETVNPITNKIHCNFNQSVAATGRLSCQDPNLQNIPRHSAIRSCFIADPGHSFVSADYSQIELRLLAHFCQDAQLIRAFKEGQDIHLHTAAQVFNVPPVEVTPAMRQQAKAVNFGILYGQSSFGLSKQLGISMYEASQFIKTYFDRYPTISTFLEECKARVRKMGYSETLTGRKRPIPEIHNKNPNIRSAAERLAVNTPLQGTAADLIKMAMIQIDREIHERGLKGKMILQIHDELIFEVPDGEINLFQDLVSRNMETVLSLSVPLKVEMAVGKNWSEC